MPCRTLLAVTLASLLLVPAGGVRAADPLDDVNVFVGTGGRGFGFGATYPGPSVPFGAARPGPDTWGGALHAPFHHFGGYHHDDRVIRGFSHTRLSGIGVPDYGNLRVMPVPADGRDPRAAESWHARFSHASERARPGYYAVRLEDAGVDVELTASAWAAVHRYTFSAGGRWRVLVDALASIDRGGARDARVEVDAVVGAREVRGRLVCSGALTGRSGGVEVFFCLRVRGEVRGAGVFGAGEVEWSGEVPDGDAAVMLGDRGAWVEVEAGPDAPVEVAVGLSYISVVQARRHLEEQVGDRGFDAVRAAAEARWRDALTRVDLGGGAREQRRILRTALYHALVMPTDITEAGGLYRGLDKKVHRAEGFRYHTDLSLWDTFRTQMPLLCVLYPERARDILRSLVRMAGEGGWLPKWPTGTGYSSCMIGTSADIAIADAWLRGVRDFDVEAAFRAAMKTAEAPTPPGAGYAGRRGVDRYIELGWVPNDEVGDAASRTIEFSWADGALANLARALGHDGEARRLEARSHYWKNLWDPKRRFLRGRDADGSFAWLFSEALWTSEWTEGNARQWLWAPLHDADELVRQLGGPEPFAKRLERFFERSRGRRSTLLPAGGYWHGNEPDIHAAYLFSWAGRPDLTQRWVRWVMGRSYADAPAGLDGNDDCGTLSAWYVWSAAGIYPVAGSARYVLGAPRFPRMTLRRPGGDLTVRCQGDPETQLYVKAVTLNGEPLTRPFLKHGQIAGASELVFTLSSEPTGWGR
jgi:predicted alpha-1,2-mannosidase